MDDSVLIRNKYFSLGILFHYRYHHYNLLLLSLYNFFFVDDIILQELDEENDGRYPNFHNSFVTPEWATPAHFQLQWFLFLSLPCALLFLNRC